MKNILCLLIVSVLCTHLQAQDTLPQFTLLERGDKVIVSWVNPYPNLVQLNVKRSFDSLKNYSTIYSAASPQLPQNGFSDRRVASNKVFYRIFYVLPGGAFYFSKIKRLGSSNLPLTRDIINPSLSSIDPADTRLISIKVQNQNFRKIPAIDFINFKDSVLKLTKDTLYAVNDTVIVIKPYVPVEMWRPSVYLYVNKSGYININLPEIQNRKYHIKFFEDSGTPLFEIKQITESPLVLEKSSFVHSGWFTFELYEDDRLKEKNKFYLPKDY